MLTVLAVVALALVAASSGAHTILPQPTSVTEGGGVVAVDAAQFKVCTHVCIYMCGCWVLGLEVGSIMYWGFCVYFFSPLTY